MAKVKNSPDQLSGLIRRLSWEQNRIRDGSTTEPPPTDQNLPPGRRQASMAPRNSWEEIIIREMPFVIQQAKKWQNGGARAGLTVMDLVMEGFLGLIKAIKKFDPERGLTFHTMARWWVVASITRAIDQSTYERGVRISGIAAYQMQNIRKINREHQAVHNADPTPAAIAELSGDISEARARTLLLTMHAKADSLEQPLPGDSNRTLSDTLKSPEPTPDATLAANEARARLVQAMESLTERQRVVITMRFGLLDGDGATLAQIGKTINTSRERVRQIQTDALKILRQRLGQE